MKNIQNPNISPRQFEKPVVKAWGTFSDLTRVGATTVGLDEWPGDVPEDQFEPGSNCKPANQDC